jgi:hypothetical protein
MKGPLAETNAARCRRRMLDSYTSVFQDECSPVIFRNRGRPRMRPPPPPPNKQTFPAICRLFIGGAAAAAAGRFYG